MSEDSEEEGGSGKVLFIVGLLVGSAIAGGAGYYFSMDDEAVQENGAQTVQRAVPVKDLISVPFDRLAVPIYSTRKNKRRFIGNYFINASIQVDGEDNQIAVKRSTAQLQHGFISAISKSELMQEDSSTELDLDKLSKVLKSKSAEIMGPGVVINVAITEATRMPR